MTDFTFRIDGEVTIPAAMTYTEAEQASVGGHGEVVDLMTGSGLDNLDLGELRAPVFVCTDVDEEELSYDVSGYYMTSAPGTYPHALEAACEEVGEADFGDLRSPEWRLA